MHKQGRRGKDANPKPIEIGLPMEPLEVRKSCSPNPQNCPSGTGNPHEIRPGDGSACQKDTPLRDKRAETGIPLPPQAAEHGASAVPEPAQAGDHPQPALAGARGGSGCPSRVKSLSTSQQSRLEASLAASSRYRAEKATAAEKIDLGAS